MRNLKKKKIPSYEGQTRYPECVLQGLSDSSPHTRGRLQRGCLDARIRRFIPSYEGQTQIPGLRVLNMAIHPLLRRADRACRSIALKLCDSSPLTKGRHYLKEFDEYKYRFIPSYEGQTLSVYAAFNHSKHPVVHFAQTPFSPHHMPSSLYLICRKNIFFITFLNIFQNSSTLIPYSSSITISLHSPTRYIFTSLKMPVSG